MTKQQAAIIELSQQERRILTQIKIGTHSEMHLKKRAEIILMASSGESNNSIERTMQINGVTVALWRNRYAKAHEELMYTEKETPKKLRSIIEATLSDALRSGAPTKFSDEQVACILALACEQPEDLGLPFSHWTPTLLQIEVVNRGIVDSISVMHISRFLKRKRFKASLDKGMVEPKHSGYGSVFE